MGEGFTKILSSNCEEVTIGKRNNSHTIEMLQTNLYKKQRNKEDSQIRKPEKG
jgi:hypothetical protein